MQQTVFGLSEDETGILPRLKSYYNAFVSSAKQYSKATEFARRLDSVILELRDMQNEAEHEAQRIEADPEWAEKLSRRLDMIYALQQKHGVRSVGEHRIAARFHQTTVRHRVMRRANFGVGGAGKTACCSGRESGSADK
ncbi:MAG: hypothetical protein L6V35_03260 [Alistipes putredinis]|nr:MAG: hypothetical protein L6V35_03260 [Alistipes putredinis]